MRVMLVNPPYRTLTSVWGVGHQVPLGLLMVGGALVDAGHEVRLVDAECERLSNAEVARRVREWRAEVVMVGHAGSTPAHPVVVRMLGAVKREVPGVVTVYGGVYPTYHAREILEKNVAVDVIVRGEGEATAVDLVGALCRGDALEDVEGIAFRDEPGEVVETPDRGPVRLDDYRVGWELIEDWDRYQCFGLGRAAIVQFSRGCPHRCTYCGQRGFWVRWRHRDPVRMADEIEWLCRERGVRFVTLADENPTTLRGQWERFLAEVARRVLPVKMFATIRAADIVRDREILPLYRRAGILYVLMGIETTDEETIRRVRKGSTTRVDVEACRLLRANGIFSILGHIVGLGGETWAGFRRTNRQLAAYEGDYLNAMYATPHGWTQFARESAGRRVVQMDRGKWDYRHQVMGEEGMRPWEVFLAVKWMEVRFHTRLGRVRRLVWGGTRFERRQRWWCLVHTGMVWAGEVVEFIRKPVWHGGRVTVREWFGWDRVVVGGECDRVATRPARTRRVRLRPLRE